jgi:hypothetical protein
MAEEVIDQLALNVRRMLDILQMPHVEDEDLPELIFRLGQTSKLEQVCLPIHSLKL